MLVARYKSVSTQRMCIIELQPGTCFLSSDMSSCGQTRHHILPLPNKLRVDNIHLSRPINFILFLKIYSTVFAVTNTFVSLILGTTNVIPGAYDL